MGSRARQLLVVFGRLKHDFLLLIAAAAAAPPSSPGVIAGRFSPFGSPGAAGRPCAVRAGRLRSAQRTAGWGCSATQVADFSARTAADRPDLFAPFYSQALHHSHRWAGPLTCRRLQRRSLQPAAQLRRPRRPWLPPPASRRRSGPSHLPGQCRRTRQAHPAAPSRAVARQTAAAAAALRGRWPRAGGRRPSQCPRWLAAAAAAAVVRARVLGRAAAAWPPALQAAAAQAGARRAPPVQGRAPRAPPPRTA